MKIWLPTLKAGTGADVFTQRLAAGLARAGHNPVVQWFPHRYELMPWRLASVRAPDSIDIIHANSWQAFAFRRRGIPLVVTEHHYVGHPQFAPYRSPAKSLYHTLFIRQCLRLSYARADALVAVSHTTARAVEKDFPGCRVDVIHNWIDTAAFCPSEAPTSRLPNAPFRLFFVGNPSRHKGSDLLPELARRLGPQFEINCLGGLRSDITISAPPSNMKFLPQTPPEAMPDLYRQMDAVVVLARYEALGFVALEAMACGIPVLGFDSTGTAEVCENETTALLSPIEDLERIVASARRLLADPALHRRLGMAGRERALAAFSEERGIQAYLAIYLEALRHRSLNAA